MRKTAYWIPLGLLAAVVLPSTATVVSSPLHRTGFSQPEEEPSPGDAFDIIFGELHKEQEEREAAEAAAQRRRLMLAAAVVTVAGFGLAWATARFRPVRITLVAVILTLVAAAMCGIALAVGRVAFWYTLDWLKSLLG